jgi:hypothetical protein
MSLDSAPSEAKLGSLGGLLPVGPGHTRPRTPSALAPGLVRHLLRQGSLIMGWPTRSPNARRDRAGALQASLVAIRQAPRAVHTTSQAEMTTTAMAVDSGTKYEESRSPAGPFKIM